MKAEKGAVAFTTLILLLVTVFAGVSVGSDWFEQNHPDHGHFKWDLWRLSTKGYEDKEIVVKHDDMCKVKDISDHVARYCMKIEAVRAMTICCSAFAFIGALLLLAGWWCERLSLVIAAVLCDVIVFASSVIGAVLGNNLSKDNGLIKDPVVGFYLVCAAAGLSSIALVLSAAACFLMEGRKGGGLSLSGNRCNAAVSGYSHYAKRQPEGNQPAHQPAGFPSPMNYGNAVAPPAGNMQYGHTGAAAANSWPAAQATAWPKQDPYGAHPMPTLPPSAGYVAKE